MTISPYQLARERAETEHLRQVGDDDLVRVVLGSDVKAVVPISTLSRASSHEIAGLLGISRSMSRTWRPRSPGSLPPSRPC